MKFTIDNEDTGTLEIRVGNNREKIKFEGLDLDNIYQWYPMNISYVLRYQEPRDRLYLYPVANPPENADYSYEERQRTKPEGVVINDIGPDMVCLNVFKDNMKLVTLADGLGLPHLLTFNYGLAETKEAIKELLEMLDAIKETLASRIKEEDLKDYWSLPLQEKEVVLYSYATDTEVDSLKQIGKLYTMMNLMRKISEKREK